MTVKMLRKRKTIIDVAKVAGVSKATVARVLTGDKGVSVKTVTRKRVLDAVKEVGYVPNRIAASMRSQRTFSVAISIPDISNPFYPEMVRGAQEALATNGYNLMMFNNNWDAKTETNHLEAMQRHMIDGILLSHTQADLDLNMLSPTPIVILGRGLDYPEFPSVGNDSVGGTKLALDRLFELGHRRIGLISGGALRATASSRQEAYFQFHKKNGLEIDEQLVAPTNFGVQTSESIAFAREAAEKLLSQPDRPSAIFASNDVLALAVLQVARALGIRVPQQLSVIGMDDIFSATVSTPALTTVAKQRYENGRLAAEKLLTLMRGGSLGDQSNTLLQCRLIERETTSSYHS
ncbi:MAG: LacI family DNA-binding transcriptional regulator [Paracoccaceae bacterium]|jgi:DNA-binding LacI/PurR family transcriptional regulator|nr:LacI family DNA-binding transcriptional regulator [Paracoccaceae bacterium]